MHGGNGRRRNLKASRFIRVGFESHCMHHVLKGLPSMTSRNIMTVTDMNIVIIMVTMRSCVGCQA